MLAINTNSFHYRYYCWIRRMWGFVDEPKTTSLCPYFQTMLWGSIFCVVASPGLVVGWIFMKLGRLACRLQNPVTDSIVEALKSHSRWIDRLDSGPTNFSESPVITGLSFTIFGLGMIVMGAMAIGVIGSVLGLLGYGAWNTVNIVVAVFNLITWILAHVFMILYWGGFVFHHIYDGAIWLFTNGPLWYIIASWIVWLLAWLLGVGVAAVILCVLFIGISKLPFAQRIRKFLTNTLNGYSEAQKAREARRAAAIKKSPPWKCGYCKYNNNPPDKSVCGECGRAQPPSMPKWWYLFAPLWPLAWLIVQIQDRKFDIIGPLGVVWSYIVAVKRGVCPIVEFVDPVQLQVEAQASAQARMEEE